MSAHLNRDSLWELASAANLPQPIQAHLATCGDCQVQLAQVKQAQALLQARAAIPPAPLDPIAARRIGAVLKEAAEQKLAPRAWWSLSFNFGWAIAGVAAVVLALLVWNQLQIRSTPAPEPIAQQQPPTPPAPAPQLAQAPAPVVPEPAPAPKLLARVTGAKKASSKQGGKLLKTQTVEEGTQLATAAGGALWLALPDGSRAGLTGNTELKIDKLEEKALSFTLEKGNVMMVARHLPERAMLVKAGEVEVRDIGTRFLVSRDVNRVLVAVEEGVVEIKAPGTAMTLKAGRSVEWREGQLREQAWAPPPPPPPKVTVASPPTPAIEAFVGADAGTTGAIAAAPLPAPAPGPAPVPPPPAPAFQNPDDEWATLPSAPKPAAPNPAVPAPAAEEDEPPVYEAPPEDEEGSVSLLARIEQRVKKVVQAPFNAVGASLRDARSRDIGKLADEGNCQEALRRADAWLADKPSVSDAEPRWRRSVLVNQMRCYTRLNRHEDASKIKAKLE